MKRTETFWHRRYLKFFLLVFFSFFFFLSRWRFGSAFGSEDLKTREGTQQETSEELSPRRPGTFGGTLQGLFKFQGRTYIQL